MRKNVSLKFLAMMLALMLMITSTGLIALADVEVYVNGEPISEQETLTYTGDVELAEATAEEGEEVSLTVDGKVDNKDIGDDPETEAAVEVQVTDGTATVKTGDIVEEDAAASEALYVITKGDDSKADVTVGEIESESNGIHIVNYGGEIAVTSGGIDCEGNADPMTTSYGLMIETDDIYSESSMISEEEFNRLYPEFNFGPEADDVWITSKENGRPEARRVILDKKENETTGETEYEYEYYHYDYFPVNGGSTTVTVNGDITQESDRNVQLLNYGKGQSVDVTINGNVKAVDNSDSAYVQVMAANAFADNKNTETSLVVNGDITAVAISTAEKPSDVSAYAINVIARNGGEVNAEINGNIVADGALFASGLSVENGNFSYDGESYVAMQPKETPPNTVVKVTGNIDVSGEKSTGINVVAASGSSDIDVEGTVTAEGAEAKGIKSENQGGTIDISVGEITSENIGVELIDKQNIEKTTYNTQNFVVDKVNDEIVKTYISESGSGSTTYLRKDGDQEIYYTVGFYDYEFEGETRHYEYIFQVWTEEKVNHDPGVTNVTVEGDVAAEKTGVKIELENDKSKMDVLVDGTLSGKTQSVLVSEDTVTDNLTLTVWKIKANEDGNLVERETEDGKTEADKELEKKIQYIIKIDPNYTNNITTQGTKEYEGYNVAEEGTTVTLKLTIPEGKRVVNAFNGTDTKVKLLQDDDGNYYLEVPRGGGVMLSLELEAIPDPEPDPEPEPEPAPKPEPEPEPQPDPEPEPEPQTEPDNKNTGTATTATAKVAIMKPADETDDTKSFKDLVGNSDIMTILPDEIKELLPEGISAVQETLTMTLENYDDTMGAVTLKIAVKKTYTKGEKATVVIALPDGNGGYTYFYIEGEGQEDGTLSLNIPAAIAKALAGKTFVTMILK